MFDSGFSFDVATGTFQMQNGTASTENVLLRSSAASISISGRTDLLASCAVLAAWLLHDSEPGRTARRAAAALVLSGSCDDERPGAPLNPTAAVPAQATAGMARPADISATIERVLTPIRFFIFVFLPYASAQPMAMDFESS